MLLPGEIVVDNFAGGGGASTGMELGLNTHVDIAINHDPAAIDMHKMNHPETKHYCESVWDVDPVEACASRPVGYAWFSPDCKHFSIAKGGKPVEKNIRGLAWIVIKWCALVPVRIFNLENVKEFKDWGPLIEIEPGVFKPDKNKKGETFRGFLKALTIGLEKDSPVWSDIYHSLFRCKYDINQKLKIYKAIVKGLGYTLEYKLISAKDYGVPTTRLRLYIGARNDGHKIHWPKPTHGPDGSGLLPYKTTAEHVIDWSLPVLSIFGRKKPLAEKTMQRIFKGIKKFVIENENPYIVSDRHNISFITEHANGSSQRNMPIDEPLRTICAEVKGGHFALVSATIDRQFGNSEGNRIDEPLGTITCGGGGKCALITSHIVKMRGDNVGHGVDEPLHTISAGGFHLGEVRAFLMKYYGTGEGESLNSPLGTVTTKDRFALVTVKGESYQIVDIGMRMLQPHELFSAMGFPKDYKISHNSNGKKLSKSSQVNRCGNAVCPPVAQALVEANLHITPNQIAA
ncbi:DNA cytosine methyltransferase [Vibrio salinus]|uniref:DNA cytosine methyltransferase n=1 Tax=Vibrio salinus TaxID=2899784 RepID=UPI001E4BB3C7|nr:DNA cytosine methyltransferase [Vibrio salinus]MCE0495739.1 DNA cytosine methyltransferase [Vibrio salinus]